MPLYSQTFGSYYLGLRLTLTELARTETDVANNRTRVEWLYELYETTDYGSYSSNLATCYLELNNSRVHTVTNFTHDFRPSGANAKTIGSGTFTCPHNADGTKTMAFTAVYNSTNVGSMGQGTLSGSLPLSTIPRATTPTFSLQTVEMGKSVTIYTARASSNFTHTLKYNFSGAVGTIATGVATSTSWTPPLATLAPKIPNATSGSCIITCETYSGSSLIGTKTASLKLTLPDNVKPSGSTSITQSDTTLANKFSAYIQSKSKVRVQTSVSGIYGSTITAVVTTFESKTYSGPDITTSVISGYGSLAITTVITDSRGRTYSIPKALTVLAYTKPTISAFSVERALSNGTLSDSGTYARVTQAFTISSLNNKNDSSWAVKHKRVGLSSWMSVSTGAVYSYSGAFTSSTAFMSGDYSWELQLVVSDYFETATVYVTIGTAFTLLDYHYSGTGLAIGKVAEKADTFEVALDAEISGILDAKDQTPYGATKIPTGTNLNTYQTPGIYFQDMNAHAVAGSNYPVSLAGTLVVTKDAGVTQMYYVYDGSGLWYRAYYDGTWYVWRQIYHSGNLPSFASTSHNHSGADITSGTVALARIGFTRSHAAKGYLNLNGTYVQWGTVTLAKNNDSVALTFPISFPNYCRSIVGSWQTNTSYTETFVVSFNGVSKTGATAFCRRQDTIGDFARIVYWVAFGY